MTRSVPDAGTKQLFYILNETVCWSLDTDIFEHDHVNMLQHALAHNKHHNYNYNIGYLNFTLRYLDAQYVILKFRGIFELPFDKLVQKIKFLENHNKKKCFKMALYACTWKLNVAQAIW